jgi:hypothetical protein
MAQAVGIILCADELARLLAIIGECNLSQKHVRAHELSFIPVSGRRCWRSRGAAA